MTTAALRTDRVELDLSQGIGGRPYLCGLDRIGVSSPTPTT
ncbi:hypothetical protein ACFW34_32020 [Streptomyces sp. NPDC058848]